MANADLQVHTGQVPRPISRAGVRVREDTVYADHRGRERKGVRKRADKALDKLQETLAKVLEPDEAILHVARCPAPAGILEQFAFGWYIYYVTATVLVFTNRRLLHFPVRRDGSWKKSLRSLRWGDLSEAKVHGLFGPRLRLKYQDGKVETYWGLRRGDAKTIKVLLPVLLSVSLGETSPAQAMSSLCPECFAGLSPGAYQCSRCSLTFKDEKTMIRRSLLIPGGGYFYTGHWFLGVGDFVAEAILLFLVVISVLLAFGFLAEPGEPQVTAGVALFEVAFFGGILGVEKLFTIYHCRRFIRDFIPTR